MVVLLTVSVTDEKKTRLSSSRLEEFFATDKLTVRHVEMSSHIRQPHFFADHGTSDERPDRYGWQAGSMHEIRIKLLDFHHDIYSRSP
jgi:hypothetical protein